MSDEEETLGSIEVGQLIEVDFKRDPIEEEAPITITRGRRCEHKQMEVDQHERTVTCKTCNETLNVFDAFMVWAEQYDRLRYWWKDAHAKKDATLSTIESLKKEQSRLQGAVNRLKKRIEKRVMDLDDGDVRELELYRALRVAPWGKRRQKLIDALKQLLEEQSVF